MLKKIKESLLIVNARIKTNIKQLVKNSYMDYIKLKEDGKEKRYPHCMFTLSSTQRYSVIGVDFHEHHIEINPGESTRGITYSPLGKLSEQTATFQVQIQNTLIAQGWNFEEYPDPEIVLITEKG